MISEGKHTAKAFDVALAMTETGKEQIAVAFQIVGGDDDGAEITWFGYFTEKTAERTIESLRHCGWTGNDLSALTAEDLPNEVQIVVEEDTYDGKTSMKVKWINRGGGVAVKNKMAPGAATAFAARMKGLCMTIKPAEGAPQKAAQRPAPRRPANPDDFNSNMPDDDIGF